MATRNQTRQDADTRQAPSGGRNPPSSHGRYCKGNAARLAPEAVRNTLAIRPLSGSASSVQPFQLLSRKQWPRQQIWITHQLASAAHASGRAAHQLATALPISTTPMRSTGPVKISLPSLPNE